VAAALASIGRAVRGAARARFTNGIGRARRWRKRLLTAWLFLAQPWARLEGRFAAGLTPWRAHRPFRLALPWPRSAGLWSERRQDTNEWLEALELRLRERRAVVVRGGPYDRWDLQVRDGACGSVRLRMCVEEHGAGRQLVRFRVWPWPFAARLAAFAAGLGATLSLLAALDSAWFASLMLGATAGLFALRIVRQTSATMALVVDCLEAEDHAIPIRPADGATPASTGPPQPAAEGRGTD
jgi:hypothetical protein